MRVTEQEYADIAAACDRLLRSPSTSLARLAIPALHLLNEHPSSLVQYAPLFADRSDGAMADIPRALIRATRGLTRALAGPPRFPRPPGPIDVLIVSHLLRPEQLDAGEDFYFGALQSRLQEQGVTSLLVFVNHLRNAPSARTLPPSAFPRWILPRMVSPA